MRMTTFALASIGAIAAMSLAAGGCELIAAVDHDLIPQGGGALVGGGGGGAPATTTTGMGGMGGAGGGPLCVPEECPDLASDCLAKACEGNMCGEPTNVAVDTACASAPGEGGGGGGTMAGVCDGMGVCVECNSNAQCTAPEVCDTTAHECVPAACQNMMLDPGETDIDCGGDDCGPCDNTEDCVDGDDCLSGFCNALVCAACTMSAQCGASEWCDTSNNGGTCVPTKADGVMCGASDECTNGNCPSNGTGQPQVCCNSPCNAGCQSCIAAQTGGTDGTCADVTAGSDPKDSCNDTATNCQGNNCAAGGVCENETAGDTCGSAAMCTGSLLNPQDTCDAGGTCQGGTAMACPDNFVCNGATACFSGNCTDHIQCVNTHYCVGFMGATGTTDGDCETKKPLTTACAADAECQSNNCDLSVCAP